MKGRIHSIESFGTVDGPGMRLVIFLQGCPMRCAYCHNPDSWAMEGGHPMTPEEILAQYEKNRPFYRGGGITATGGEPLMQLDFLTELFTLAKRKEIHTCIDTSGVTFNPKNSALLTKLERLMSLTDLVMLDIKHIDPAFHRDLTGHSNAHILQFAVWLEKQEKDFWVRHVVVPGLTDDDRSLYELGRFLGQFRHLKALDLLPYHSMGVPKYAQLGMTYPLAGTPDMDKEELVKKKQVILKGLQAGRARHISDS